MDDNATISSKLSPINPPADFIQIPIDGDAKFSAMFHVRDEFQLSI